MSAQSAKNAGKTGADADIFMLGKDIITKWVCSVQLAHGMIGDAELSLHLSVVNTDKES